MRIHAGRSLRSFVALALCALVTTGCTTAIGGTAAKVGSVPDITGTNTPSPTTSPVAAGPSGPKPGVAPAVLQVTDNARTPSDIAAVNTIADLYTYYTDIFPKDFGKTFTPARALMSYDSNDKNAEVCGDRSLYKSVNASYNPACDTIIWDRGVLMPQLTKQIGALAAPTVLAHEMGHLVQNRLGMPITASTPTILLEQQADCYAGSYWRWVADGNSKYYNINQTDGMRQALTALLSVGDPVGSSATSSQAHGSGFDRSFTFSLGYANGAVRCSQITEAEVDQRIKETGFTEIPKDYGNVPVTTEFISQITTVVNAYFSAQVPAYRAPTIGTFTGDSPPTCDGSAPAGTSPVGYCAATNTVSYNLSALQKLGTPNNGFDSKNGDFSAIIMLVSRFGLAAEMSAGRSTTGNQAGLQALCDAGSWANWMRQPQGPQKLQLSPNDLDKAVYEVMASPVPASDATEQTSTAVIDQVQALYVGVIYNFSQCGNFYSN